MNNRLNQASLFRPAVIFQIFIQRQEKRTSEIDKMFIIAVMNTMRSITRVENNSTPPSMNPRNDRRLETYTIQYILRYNSLIESNFLEHLSIFVVGIELLEGWS